MENQLPTHEPKFRHLARYYGLALCSIAVVVILSQVLVQRFIHDQENDSRMVNLSGRQRMLSQQIAKSALLLGSSTDPEDRKSWLDDLETALQDWTHAHHVLQQGDDSLINQGENSKKIKELFLRVHYPYQQIKKATEGMIQKLRQDILVPSPYIADEIHTITAHEDDFLKGMDEIVFQYEREAKMSVKNLQSIEIFLMTVCLGVIFFEIFFVFFPSVRSIQRSIQKLAESEEKSKAMALEIGALHSSLEQAYQDLLEVDVAVEDNTVYAKCDQQGDIYYISERFAEVMEFEEEKPRNIFNWLVGQGYDSEYLKNIHEVVLTGNSWSGDIRAINDSGDFIWLKLNIVPTLNELDQVETLMIISANETEKKEAEAISREINKEKIESKVKEQQFRTALI